MIRLEIPILFLEYYASGQTVCILKWGYSVAQSFSYETNWYIGTITGKNRSSVHSLFFAVYSVGIFTNGHGQLSVTKGIGNSLSILIPVYSSAEGFTEYTEWNHRSPVAVYIWSSIAGNDIIIYNIISRIDRHYNGGIGVNIFWTKSIFKGTCVNSIVLIHRINNSNYNVRTSFYIRVQSDNTFTIINSCVCAYICFNISICNRSRLYISVNISAINIYSIALFINNGHINLIILICWAIIAIKCQAVFGQTIDNRQFFLSKLTVYRIKSFDFDNSTNDIARIINYDFKVMIYTTIRHSTCIKFGRCNSAAKHTYRIVICTKFFISWFFNSICIDHINIAINSFASNYSIIKTTSLSAYHLNIDASDVAKFSERKSSLSFVATFEANFYSVFTSDKIIFSFSTNVIKGPHLISGIPFERDIRSNQV